MKKRFCLRLTALLVVLAVIAAFCACAGSDKENDGSPRPNGTEITNSPNGPTASRMPLVPTTSEIYFGRTSEPNSAAPTDGGGQE